MVTRRTLLKLAAVAPLAAALPASAQEVSQGYYERLVFALRLHDGRMHRDHWVPVTSLYGLRVGDVIRYVPDFRDEWLRIVDKDDIGRPTVEPWDLEAGHAYLDQAGVVVPIAHPVRVREA